jgi:RNA polymerase sigma factor (sigma-70 family)
LTDPQIISSILHGGNEENSALRFLYRTHFPAVRSLIRKNNGDEDEAKEVFQQAMIALYKNIKSGKFKGESSIGTYLYSICRFTWLKTLKKSHKTILSSESVEYDKTISENESSEIDLERESIVGDLFRQLGEVCSKLLKLVYFENLPMKEVALNTGFKDEQNARNKKLKCMNQLRQIISENSIAEQRLRELF